MRKKEEKGLVTFPTTAASMAMERACGEENLPGRLIPVPSSLSAGCGFAWCFAPGLRGSVEKLLLEKGIEYEQILLRMV